jgi:tRNA (Guanine-1)-methyltransferase
VSLTSQLAYTYSANRKAVCPFEHLLFTSLNGKTLARMESLGDAGYKRWNGTEWWSDGYQRLWEGKEHVQDLDSKTNSTMVDKQTVVYLTADSSEELLELKEGETYIIGGICDHNRYKVRDCHLLYMTDIQCALESMSGQSCVLGYSHCSTPNWKISCTAAHTEGVDGEPGS